MRARDVFFGGIGIYLPEIETVESAVARGLCQADEMAAVGFRGVTVAGDLPAPEMALHASRDALKNAGVSPADLAALLYVYVWHQGPEGWGPPHYLQRYLTGDDMFAVEVKDGCNGMFSGIELALGLLRAEPDRKAALVTAGDNFGTPLFKRWESGAQNTVMGDGASAVVLTKDEGFAQLLSICTASYSDMEEADRAGTAIFPPGITEGRMADYKARHEAFGRKVFAEGVAEKMFITHQQRAAECANRALAEAGIGRDDLKRVIIHNIGRGDATAYLGMLGFELDQSTWSYGCGIGHTGASDHLISLCHLLATAQLGPGDHVLLTGMAPGVTYKSAVVKIIDIPPWARSMDLV
jgi:3-oxoacyl-[acyl-carrier-protein] synthase-3/clorobiocin biosynthesis protein CloN2